MRGKQLTWPNKSHSHYEEGFHHGKGFKNWSGLLKEVRDHNLKQSQWTLFGWIWLSEELLKNNVD